MAERAGLAGAVGQARRPHSLIPGAAQPRGMSSVTNGLGGPGSECGEPVRPLKGCWAETPVQFLRWDRQGFQMPLPSPTCPAPRGPRLSEVSLAPQKPHSPRPPPWLCGLGQAAAERDSEWKVLEARAEAPRCGSEPVGSSLSLPWGPSGRGSPPGLTGPAGGCLHCTGQGNTRTSQPVPLGGRS